MGIPTAGRINVSKSFSGVKMKRNFLTVWKRKSI